MQVGMLCAVHESQVGCGAASTRSTDATSWRQAAASKPMSVPSETKDAPAAILLRASSALRANTPAGLPAPRMRLMPSTALASAKSEEHTSELQSLMRISYAAFCLKT